MTMIDTQQVLRFPRDVIEHVTPELAAAWLTRNVGNRRLSKADVARWASEMRAGRWSPYVKPVMFDWNGNLLDGQHRLNAVIETGMTIPMKVTYDLDPELLPFIDNGRARKNADVLTMKRERNASVLAATVRLAIAIEAGDRWGKVRPASSEVLEYLDRHPELRESVNATSGLYRNTDMTHTAVAYAHWRMSQIDAAEAARFWTDAAEKVGLAPGDPVLALTKRMGASRRARERLTPEILVAAIFRTWNARRAGVPLAKLQLTGKNGEIAMVEPK